MFASIVAPYAELPWYRKLFAGPAVPPDFPQTSVSGRAVPIVYLAAGTVTIADGQFEFSAEWPGHAYRSTYDDIELSAALKELTVLRRFRQVPALGDQFSISWIEIDCDDFAEPFLICSSGRSMEQIATRTDELFEAIDAGR
jgi:hypothetical protein